MEVNNSNNVFVNLNLENYSLKQQSQILQAFAALETSEPLSIRGEDIQLLILLTSMESMLDSIKRMSKELAKREKKKIELEQVEKNPKPLPVPAQHILAKHTK